MLTVYLVRHGQYVNPKNILPLRLDGYPLSSGGIKQIEELSNYFIDKNIEAIISSPLLRTKQTANIIGKKLKIKPVFFSSLMEVKSPYQGINQEEYNVKVKDLYTDPYHLNGGGEKLTTIYTRMKITIFDFVKNQRKNKIVVVSHGDPIMIFVNSENNQTNEYIPMGGLIELNYDDNFQVIKKTNINY